MRYILILALALSAAAFAQRAKSKPAAPKPAAAEPAPPADKWPIETLKIEGNHNYSREQILAVAGIKVGQTAGRAEFEAAQQRLEATGAFETVSYKFGPSPGASGYVATIQVVEAEPVFPAHFQDLGVPDQEVTAWLRAHMPLFGPKIPGTRQVLDRCAKSIQDLLASRGKTDRVIARMMPAGPDQFVILFRPNRPEAVVAEVSFEGNQVIPATMLQNAIGGVAVGVEYSQPAFRDLLNNSVKPLYDARGRVRASFPQIVTEKARDVEGLAVRVTVNEGPSFDLGEVTLDNRSEIKTDELLKAANLKKGDLANFDVIGEGVERMKKRLRRDGYMRVTATVDRAIHDDKKTVDLVVHLDEGPRFFFGKLTLTGLDLDGEAAMRKLWALKEGKPFNPEYPDYFLAQIKERGLFDNLNKTRSAVAVNEKDRTVDVTLSFR